jgi:NAD(P)-dependent dehydrogenase (short-subunit alcohol dehydrogenase family)
MVYKGLDLQGKVAVVLGGTSGIGHAISTGLAQAGADVIPTGRRNDLVDEAATEIESLGRHSVRVACDVHERSSLNALLDAAVKKFGRVEILIYAAGITQRGPFLGVTEEAWDNVMETNLTGAFRACQIFGSHMVQRGYGRIVTIGSLGSYLGLNEVAAYSASKAGLASLTRTLAVEWARFGVCVNAIVPGVFPTALNKQLLDGTPRGQEFLTRTPMKRFGKVEELVGGAIFLASDAASFVTGTMLHIDGGILASGVNQ